MANYHVIKKSSGGWAVKREKGERSTLAPTQRAAERIAKDRAAKSGGGEVVIHRRDGKIRDKDTMSPARDPFPPKG